MNCNYIKSMPTLEEAENEWELLIRCTNHHSNICIQIVITNINSLYKGNWSHFNTYIQMTTKQFNQDQQKNRILNFPKLSLYDHIIHIINGAKLFQLIFKFAMRSCAVKECGRKFENDETMLEHVRRRHKDNYEEIRNNFNRSIIENQHAQQQELKKLPKLVKIMSKQKKTLQLHRRSSSKGMKEATIIQQSRQFVNPTGIAARKPSLTKKTSASDLMSQKLPVIETKLKKSRLEVNQPSTPIETVAIETKTAQNFYTTAPNFNLKSKVSLKSKSKEKKRSQEKLKSEPSINVEQSKVPKKLFDLNQVNQDSEIEKEKKKGLTCRPAKKVSDRKIQQQKPIKRAEIEEKYDFDERVVVVKFWHSEEFELPTYAKLQTLFLNNLGLRRVNLNGLESLIELSLVHNSLTDVDFLRYNKNFNLRNLYLDYNELTDLYVPPKVRVLTASFNKIGAEQIDEICSALKKSPQLEEIDFSFNQLRKANNYKLILLSGNPKLKKIDGLKVTKIDLDMMKEFCEIQSIQRGLIPLGSNLKDRPSTSCSSISQTTNSLSTLTIDELLEECKYYEKATKQTKQQLAIIQQENEIISSQLAILKSEFPQQLDENSFKLYLKLQKECESLEVLNYMVHADEQQLKALVQRKRVQLGLPDKQY